MAKLDFTVNMLQKSFKLKKNSSTFWEIQLFDLFSSNDKIDGFLLANPEVRITLVPKKKKKARFWIITENKLWSKQKGVIVRRCKLIVKNKHVCDF